MLEEFGDFWHIRGDLFCVTTNGATRISGDAVMGKGVALQARRKYPDIEIELGKLIRLYGNHVFHLGHRIISFPTKHHWRQDSDIKLIKRSATELVMLLENNPVRRVLLTRPGCGNGNLKWDDVKPAIQDILGDDKFIIIYNTQYKKKCTRKCVPNEEQWK